MIFPALVYIDAEPMGANITGIPFRVEQYNIVCLQLAWIGTPVGAIKLQGSIVPDGLPPIWTDLPEGSLAVNGPDSTLFNYSQMGWYLMRIIYTRSSGTGSLTAYMGAKP